ncbi:alpha/beta-hydrolase [Hesseltinella vesiculosa]|uniref:Alpha/beta-hydrolase n=1 Tax=Hesseltinella vesiculosa TaxID=101127 RepID=A0A1X2G541_9FUNG|nr:alpha/beta-hydrolase [Hesseltinella vesiculosa]
MTASEKISIVNCHGEAIVGILEQKAPLTSDHRLVLFCHGVLGHKDYLFFRLLAEKLPLNSFRFDFRGNGESQGQTGYAHMNEDIEDIATVASHFEKLGYEIFAIVGHSRGSTSCLKYATICPKPVPHIVNCAGCYSKDASQILNRPEVGAAFDAHGYFDWTVRQRDRIVQIRVTRDDIDKACAWDNSHVKHMPFSTCVLTVHGINDNIVPVYNAAMFANAIPNHTLNLLPDADHNFKGHFEDVVGAIVDYFSKHDNPSTKASSMNLPSTVALPRWIDVEGVKNFRDIGGWTVKDGSGYIRERTVFRSAHLGAITEAGIRTLQQLNVQAVFDFRSQPEIDRYGMMREVPDIKVYPSAMYEKIDFSPEKMADHWKAYFEGPRGIARAYKHTLKVAKTQYRKLFVFMLEQMSKDARSAMLVHCTAGKDRTGVWCMLLLGLCGVPDEIIAQEYALTNVGYWVPEEELKVRASNIGCTVDQARDAVAAPYDTMIVVLEVLREEYGSVEGYLQQACELTQKQCDQLRAFMIVPINFDQKGLCRRTPDVL